MPSIHHETDRVTVWHGDCLDVLRDLPDASVDAIVTDPPYGLANTTPAQVAETLTAWIGGDRTYIPSGAGFMGKSWDAFVPPVAVWDECLRVLKPGGHALVFAGARTADLMGLALRLAGFEIRDSIHWVAASGFPKSLDVSKAIDKAAGAERQVIGTKMGLPGYTLSGGTDGGGILGDGLTSKTTAQRLAETAITAPASPAARQWEGWGTALKPAHEPVIVGRKPLASTVAANVQQWGTGALNIDGCRVGNHGGTRGAGRGPQSDVYGDGLNGAFGEPVPGLGRWPSNLVLSHSDRCGPDDAPGECVDGCPVRELDAQSGFTRSPKTTGRGASTKRSSMEGGALGAQGTVSAPGDEGGASRFFPVFRYQAKAPTDERPRHGDVAHPTVKPLDLMRWLVRLVTQPGGTVLEPFAGSGSTVEACILEGFRCVAIEREADYLPLIVDRVTKHTDPVRHLLHRADGGADVDLGLFALLDGESA